jgi:hypothetical protein
MAVKKPGGGEKGAGSKIRWTRKSQMWTMYLGSLGRSGELRKLMCHFVRFTAQGCSPEKLGRGCINTSQAALNPESVSSPSPFHTFKAAIS